MKPCRHPCCPDTGPCRKAKPRILRKRLNPVSKKQGKRNREYSKERKRFLEEGDMCEARLEGCTGLATDLHHPLGRIGDRLTDVNKCKKVCRNCHNRIESEPVMAKQLGLSESRLTSGNETV